MALTGRLGLLALLGAVVPLFAPSWWTLFAVWGVLLLGVAADLALAGNVRALRFHRSGATSVRLGETAQVSADRGEPRPAAPQGPAAGRVAAQRGRHAPHGAGGRARR